MASTAFPNHHVGTDREPLLLRTRVLLSRRALTHQLADGADPHGTHELAWRTQQLLSERHRGVLASSLERVVRTAEERPRPHGAAVSIRRQEILGQREQMRWIARQLRDSEREVGVRGVALVERMLTEGDSPLYSAYAEESLASTLDQARVALGRR